MPIISLQKTNENIHLAVWEISETHDELMAMLSSEILTDAELAEISHPLKQVEFFASRLCIQYLANNLNIKYLGVKKDENGKPFLVGSDWQMSLTHTSKYIAIVMHASKSLGIDMEKPTEKLRRISHKFLTENEAADANNDLEKLCIYWSAKEVLYKLYGKRKVIFNEHLYVFPFNKNEELLKGKIQIAHYQAVIDFKVSKWQEYFLVIGIEGA
jgi:4'-phosphopantetheinyl transferase